MKIRVVSTSEVLDGAAEGADAIISISSTAMRHVPGLAPALRQATREDCGRLLRLQFDDIGLETYGKWTGAEMEQIARALVFGRDAVTGANFFEGRLRDEPLVAVHSQRGESRSAAVALGLLADALGEGGEQAAVNALLAADIDTRMSPNPWVVGLIDDCLFRYGGIDRALSAMSARYAAWKTLWRDLRLDARSLSAKQAVILQRRLKAA